MVPKPGFWEQWEQLHGEGICTPDSPRWVIHQDGAQRELFAMGRSIDPPADAHELAKLISKFHQEKLRRATKEFKEQKQQLAWGADAGIRQGSPPPDDNQIEHLKQLAKVVRERRKSVKDAQEAVEDSIPQAVRERERQAAANREANQEFLGKLKQIKV